MGKWLACAIGLLLAVNAAWMLVTPEAWYAAIPGVSATGPANSHFIRDIGCAYLVVALSLFWLARSPKRAWPAAAAGGAFLTLHALVHLAELFTGHGDVHRLPTELLTVHLPAILTLWLAFTLGRAREKE